MASYEVSDGLKKLKERFTRHGSGVSMNAAGVAFIAAEIEQLRAQALSLEHENSKLRWNDLARREQEETEAVLEAFHRPGSNIVLFPVIDRSNPFPPSGAA